MSTPRSLNLSPIIRQRSITTPSGAFATLEAGSVDDPVALLVPGWTGSKEDFIAVLEPLATAGYHAVALDQRGQYETPAQQSADGDFSLATFAADLLAVVSVMRDDAPRPTHLVGHSFGGLVARDAAIADPEAVASLTLLCSGPAALPRVAHRTLTTMADAIPSVGLAATWQAKRFYDKTNDAPEVTPEIEAFLEKRFCANDPESLRAITLHLTTAPDRVEALAASGVPVQVVFGVDDDAWPLDDQRDMARRLAAPVHVIPDAGHSPAVENPDALVEILTQFWTSAMLP